MSRVGARQRHRCQRCAPADHGDHPVLRTIQRLEVCGPERGRGPHDLIHRDDPLRGRPGGRPRDDVVEDVPEGLPDRLVERPLDHRLRDRLAAVVHHAPADLQALREAQFQSQQVQQSPAAAVQTQAEQPQQVNQRKFNALAAKKPGVGDSSGVSAYTVANQRNVAQSLPSTIESIA